MSWVLISGDVQSRFVLGVVILFLTVFTACAEDVPEPPPVLDVKNSTGQGSLVVYSGRSKSLVDPVIKQFAAVSGIDVRVKYGKTAEIAAILLEEGERSPADIFFAQDPGGLAAVATMMVPLPDGFLGRVPAWARSPKGEWVGISGRARVIVYNTDSVSPSDIPSSMMGFTDSKWKSRIAWAPTNGSFQAMITAMRLLWGEDKTRSWLQSTQANAPAVYPKNTPIVAAVGAGEADVGFVNHYYLYRFLQEEGDAFGARNYHLTEGGPGATVLVAGMGILKTTENIENAEKFIDFMLSEVAQQYFASQTFEYPMVNGVKTHRLLTPLNEIKNPKIDMVSLDDLRGTQELLRSVGLIP